MKTTILIAIVGFLAVKGMAVTVPSAVLDAIAMVESGNRNGILGDRHLKSPSVGAYQIRACYLQDVLRVYGSEAKKTWGKTPTMEDMRYNPKMARWTVSRYLSYYGGVYQKKTGLAPTPDVFWKIHNGGPFGYRKDYKKLYAATSAYSKKAKRFYQS